MPSMKPVCRCKACMPSISTIVKDVKASGSAPSASKLLQESEGDVGHALFIICIKRFIKCDPLSDVATDNEHSSGDRN